MAHWKGVSKETEAAWQTFAARGPWLNRGLRPSDYGLLYEFTIRVHMHRERVRGADVANRLVEEGLVADHDMEGSGRDGHSLGAGIGALHDHLLVALNFYDELRHPSALV
jgi:hypothetical protein